jgi:hypothetical protein
MNSIELLLLSLALIPYLLTHAIIIAVLFRLRRSLPVPSRAAPAWLVLAMVLPVVGPFVSSFVLARIARAYQAATAHLAAFRSDCGNAAGIGYGLVYAAATWSSSAELGLLSLALLGLFFWQAFAARRALTTSPSIPLFQLPPV